MKIVNIFQKQQKKTGKNYAAENWSTELKTFTATTKNLYSRSIVDVAYDFQVEFFSIGYQPKTTQDVLFF